MQRVLFDYIAQYITLTEAEQRAVSALNIFRSVRKGTVLLREGQRSTDGYFVLEGCIRMYYLIDGEEKTTAFYTEMETVTPSCVVSRAPSPYYLATTEDSILTGSNPDMEKEVFAQFPKFETLCRPVTEELVVKQQITFDDFKTSSPEQRYLSLVEQRPDLIRRVPAHQLASFLGIKPQSLSRLRARIRARERG